MKSLMVVLSVFILIGCQKPNPSVEKKKTHLYDYKMGGDFTLTDQNGKEFRLNEHRGKILLLFFGYTLCPDVCPATLAKLMETNKILGAESKDIQIVFVSVDPERDTPKRLKAYFNNFDAKIIGLTGLQKEIAKVARLYGAMYRKNFSGSAAGYLVDHYTRTFLIDQKGKVRYLFSHREKPGFIASVIRLLLPPKGF